MAATERKIHGTFTRVTGGYSRRIDAETTVFVPDSSVSRYDAATGQLYGYAPDYDALEASKAPAQQADAPGEYAYCYEMQRPPVGCDYSAQRSYYGRHYHVTPLRPDLPRLHGRGITCNDDGSYTVTARAYDKLTQQYRIQYEMCLD